MLRYLRLILLFTRLSIQNDAAYRFDFLLRVFVSVLHLLGELVALWIIYSNTRELNGWDVWKTLTLLGVYRVMVGAIGLFVAPNMRRTMDDIRQGTLDYVLLRPLNHQFLASARNIVVWRLSDVLLGLGLAAFASWRLLDELSLLHLLTVVLMLATGVAVVYAIWLILATSSFWFTRIQNIEMVFWNVFEVGRYPIAIYPPRIRWILTFVIPVAFVTTVPAEACFGAARPGVVAAGLALAAALLVAASLFWRHGVRHYSGASA